MSTSSPPRPNRFKWLITTGVVLVLLCLLGVLAVLFTACSFNKYVLAAGLPTPDHAYQTGSIYGYDVYIWDCYRDRRIVLWRTSAEMTQSAFTREETACGAMTPIENQLKTETKRERDPHGFW